MKILALLCAVAAVSYANILPAFLGGAKKEPTTRGVNLPKTDVNSIVNDLLGGIEENCFNAQERALRAVRTVLRIQLSPHNAMFSGMINNDDV
jgi:hypothetical protein